LIYINNERSFLQFCGLKRQAISFPMCLVPRTLMEVS